MESPRSCVGWGLIGCPMTSRKRSAELRLGLQVPLALADRGERIRCSCKFSILFCNSVSVMYNLGQYLSAWSEQPFSSSLISGSHHPKRSRARVLLLLRAAAGCELVIVKRRVSTDDQHR